MNSHDDLLIALRDAAEHVEMPSDLDPDRMARRAVRQVRFRRAVLAGGAGALALLLVVGGVRVVSDWADALRTGATAPAAPGTEGSVEEGTGSVTGERVEERFAEVVLSLPGEWTDDGEDTVHPPGTSRKFSGVTEDAIEMSVFVHRDDGWPGWATRGNVSFGRVVSFPAVPGADMAALRVQEPTSAASGELVLRTGSGSTYRLVIQSFEAPDGLALLDDVVSHLRIEAETSPVDVADLPPLEPVATGLPDGWQEVSAGPLRFGVPGDWIEIVPRVEDAGAALFASPDQPVAGGQSAAVVAVRPTLDALPSILDGPQDAGRIGSVDVEGARSAVVRVVDLDHGDTWTRTARVDVEADDGRQYTLRVEVPPTHGGDDRLAGILGTLRVTD